MKHIIALFLLITGQLAYSQNMLLFKHEIIPRPQIDITVEKWNHTQLNFKVLNAQEQEFYYWVNYSRSNPRRFFDSAVVPITDVYPQLKRKNLESLRKDLEGSASLPLLTLNIDLLKMAKKHAVDIVSQETKPSHNSTNGDRFSDRFKQKNLKSCGAENLSFGACEPLFLLVLLYLDIDVPELGHRKNLLNPSYVETGIGAETYKNGIIFIVEDFACAQH